MDRFLDCCVGDACHETSRPACVVWARVLLWSRSNLCDRTQTGQLDGARSSVEESAARNSTRPVDVGVDALLGCSPGDLVGSKKAPHPRDDSRSPSLNPKWPEGGEWARKRTACKYKY